MAVTEGVNRALVEAITAFSVKNEYLATQFAQAVCTCGGRVFSVLMDDESGCAARTCIACDDQQAVADGEEYLDEAEELGECACPCDNEMFELVGGVALYANSNDVKWFYVGLQCSACDVAAVYGDWKIGGGDASEFLASI